MPLTVTIIVGRDRHTIAPGLASEPLLFPAQHVLVEIEGDGVPAEILVNDDPQPVVRTADCGRGHVLLDRFRSTGFHRCEIAGNLYFFGTSDAKLELDGILTILRTIGHEGLSWGHQLVFSDGAAIRDPRVDYAWLRHVGRTVLEACNAIADRPMRTRATELRFQRPRGGRIRLAETLSRIRANPAALLEEHEHGLLTAPDGRRMIPRKVVAAWQTTTFDTPGNRRATSLLQSCEELAVYVASAPDLPQRHRQWVEAFAARLRKMAARFPFVTLAHVANRVSHTPSVAELTDPRYATVFRLHEELLSECGWEPTRVPSERFAYVGYSDEVYQAFVAVLLAKAFGLKRAVPYLRGGLRGPCFEAAGWEMYYDTVPPKPAYQSWRDRSSRPADLTPDFCLIDRRCGRGLLGDAKYRATDGQRRLPSSSLNDCQVYMQHFGIHTFAAFYPGPERRVTEVAGNGNTILEVSVTPFDGVADWMTTVVRPKLEALMEPVH